MNNSQEESSTCHGPGAVALAVVLSVVLTAVALALLHHLWKKFRKRKELILETDPEKGKSDYAFDNPGFKDPGLSPIAAKEKDKPEGNSNSKPKWTQWSPLGAISIKSEKKKTVDDSALEDNPVKVVALRSHDFTGLGFNICGNMKEGIYIKDVLHRGPASESGKLNPGDRINSVTISFEHMVYEDALTILSYASPYEVVLEARGGKIIHHVSGQGARPTHPVYRSSSSADLYQMGNTTKRRLFPDSGSMSSNYSSLQKSRSNMTTLERKDSKKPSPEPQKVDNKFQKFGIRVLPCETSPKIAELSQNENNINLEKQPMGIDEVDEQPKPQVKKREKKPVIEEPEVAFSRDNVTNTSGIKRDANGIPQEIPSYMMNAAVAARSNRKSIDEDIQGTPKKSKGKAPAPPEPEKNNFDEIQPVGDELDSPLPKTNIENLEEEIEVELRNKIAAKEYNSDSDNEPDNQSSVNTIELNSSDITIHHEENEERQNRRTASTGDLTKIQRTRKSSNGTLERAQSLDITDTGIPSLSKKRRMDDEFMGSEEDIFGKVMMSKEPRLSLILNGLNTFQRNKLKKSTEWGNLEDAILKLNQEDEGDVKIDRKSEEFDALVNKADEIKRESLEVPVKKIKNQIWPMELENDKSAIASEDLEDNPRLSSVEKRQRKPPMLEKLQVSTKPAVPEKKEFLLASPKKTTFYKAPVVNKSDESKTNETNSQVEDVNYLNLIDLTRTFIFTEKIASSQDESYFRYLTKTEDTNISDDIKVSRHSLGSLERPKSDDAKMNVSSITVNDLHSLELNVNEPSDVSDLYTTALDNTITPEHNVTISTPDIIKNATITEAINKLNNDVTLEGPSSLPLEILEDTHPKLNGSKSLTYITEIQVTPTTNISEIAINPNIENDFENYVKNFESNVQKFENTFESSPSKDLHKIHEIAEEQLKKLPEMRFTMTSHEAPRSRQSQIELLRSNFEKSPPKRGETTPPKSRIPIATGVKTPPTSPERRDSRDMEAELVEMMTSTPLVAKAKGAGPKNVTVTSIRNNSKIPSGLARRRSEDEHVVQVSTNGDSGFKQWVFNPMGEGQRSVTNIVVSEGKQNKA